MRTNPKIDQAPGGYRILLTLPTPGRIYLHPFHTWGARYRRLGRHDVITSARFLQRDKPRSSPKRA